MQEGIYIIWLEKKKIVSEGYNLHSSMNKVIQLQRWEDIVVLRQGKGMEEESRRKVAVQFQGQTTKWQFGKKNNQFHVY